MPASDGTLNTVAGYIDGKNFSATGFSMSPDQRYAAEAASGTPDSEDGGRTIGIVDLKTNTVIRQVGQAYGKPGFDCPVTPIPRASPSPKIGGYAGTNGVTFSSPGGGTRFTANRGTHDVRVISLQKALAGDPGAELARIPTGNGGFGISTSPNGKLVVLAAREELATDRPGNTISIIDVGLALSQPAKAEVARMSSRTFAATTSPSSMSPRRCPASPPRSRARRWKHPTASPRTHAA